MYFAACSMILKIKLPSSRPIALNDETKLGVG
jgi:hypothetical protein